MTPASDPKQVFWLFFATFFRFLGSGSGLKMLLGPVRSFSRSRFLISSILDPFRIIFCILGRPQYCVFLQDRECSSSATRKFSPNPSYLHFGEFPWSWDTKSRSSHTQIVHIEILRAQMYLKSDETEGNLLSEHMDIFCQQWTFGPEGCDIIFYQYNNQFSHFLKTPVLFYPKLFGSDRDLRLEI